MIENRYLKLIITCNKWKSRQWIRRVLAWVAVLSFCRVSQMPSLTPLLGLLLFQKLSGRLLNEYDLKIFKIIITFQKFISHSNFISGESLLATFNEHSFRVIEKQG